jgi:hypothetical protein
MVLENQVMLDQQSSDAVNEVLKWRNRGTKPGKHNHRIAE